MCLPAKNAAFSSLPSFLCAIFLHSVVWSYAWPFVGICLRLDREKFAVVNTFLRKQLHLDEFAPLFVYVNSAFAPTPGEMNRASNVKVCLLACCSSLIFLHVLSCSLCFPSIFIGAWLESNGFFVSFVLARCLNRVDQRVGELYRCFGRAGELQLCYSLQEAWG